VRLESRFFIEQPHHFAGRGLGRFVVNSQYHAGQLARAKWDQYAAARARAMVQRFGKRIREWPV
jgi:hypothetical protein